jgi:hypothetical protein
VHRSLDSEVFLAAYTAAGESGLQADVALRADHPRVRTRHGELSPSIVLEVFRQGAFLSAHERLGIPLEWHFVTKRAVLTWVRRPPLVPPAGSMRCALNVQTIVEEHKQGEPFSLTWKLRLLQEGHAFAVGELRGWTLAPPRYHALRRTARALTNPGLPALTTTPDPDVIVVWDEQDSFLFNRGGDHVVSMALTDAVLAAATSTESTQLVTFAMEFRRFAELTDPIHCSIAQRTGGMDIFTFSQSDEVTAEAVTYSVRMHS